MAQFADGLKYAQEVYFSSVYVFCCASCDLSQVRRKTQCNLRIGLDVVG